MAKTVGIDLGTTNPVVAVLEGGAANSHYKFRWQPLHPFDGWIY